ncbi:hypothetical protein K3181_14600 [Qipengyuania sp. YG27]|uniref:Lipoprotein n=1 Tax=Qipengyuania mesophila TaxID=2867246 RepID=A0ABS7JYR2_9SPHN|nr:hypothetical protein [Qipengyuania mesophila]MBX7502668.1 hypothetical protein [Qipengyuania mesophila]
MRRLVLVCALALAACSNEPTEEERAAAVAEVEANQTPPPEQLELAPIRYREIEQHDLFGAGCSFAPEGGGLSAVALAMAETGHFLRGSELVTMAADKGSRELPYLARRKYDGKAYSMVLDLDEAEGEQSGEETSDYPATLTIRDANDEVVYRKPGMAQCGA